MAGPASGAADSVRNRAGSAGGTIPDARTGEGAAGVDSGLAPAGRKVRAGGVPEPGVVAALRKWCACKDKSGYRGIGSPYEVVRKPGLDGDKGGATSASGRRWA